MLKYSITIMFLIINDISDAVPIAIGIKLKVIFSFMHFSILAF